MTERICAVTGASGLLGWHGSAAARFKHQMTVRRDTRAMWSTPDDIRDLVDGASVVLHFAALNRAPDADVEAQNAAITTSLVAALRNCKPKPRFVVFSNSTHIDRDTAYGASKRETARQLAQIANEIGATFLDVVLPNVFGECGKPFSNSVVHTFCRQLTDGETPRADGNATIQFIHAGCAIDRMFAEIAAGGSTRQIRVDGTPIAVPALLTLLQGQLSSYQAGIFPNVDTRFELEMFNTLRSYLLPGSYPFALKLNTDNRGALAECIKSGGGGQVFYSSTKPGITRGNHFHFGKIERFVVLEGDATIRIRRLFDGKVHEFPVTGSTPVAVDMPTLHTHNITNTGSTPLITLFWTHEIFDPERPDTYAEPV